MVFESGGTGGSGPPLESWERVQVPVSTFTRTVAYDRAGTGFSALGPKPRDGRQIAVELHTALRNAGVPPPYILVGHSFGGLVMRRFALLYPEEVAGLVLVDPMRCDEWPPLNPAKKGEIKRGRALIRCGIVFSTCGVARLALTALFPAAGNAPRSSPAPQPTPRRKSIGHVVYRLRSEVGKMPRAVWPMVAAHWSRPDFYAGMRKHIDAIPHTVREMDSAEAIRDIPVVVLTPGKSTPLSADALGAIGNRVRQVIASASTHWVHLDEPVLVIDAIRSLVAETEAVMIPAAETIADVGSAHLIHASAR